MPETLSLFSTALNEIAEGPRVTSHVALTEALMRRMAEKGATLDDLTDRKMMKRSRATLERYAKRFQIAFPDFTPSNMRKFVSFRRRGDFYELVGPQVQPVANALGIVVMERDGQDLCCVPAHGYAEAKKSLRSAGFEARVHHGKPA